LHLPIAVNKLPPSIAMHPVPSLAQSCNQFLKFMENQQAKFGSVVLRRTQAVANERNNASCAELPPNPKHVLKLTVPHNNQAALSL
jgi:hypothetical protein